MEKEICQAISSLTFSSDKEFRQNTSLQTSMYIKYMTSATLFPLEYASFYWMLSGREA